LLERASKEALPETAARNLAAARSIESPVLLVRGAASDVISADIAAEFCAHVPAATCVDVADAGHMVAGDQNDRFVGAILPFLAGIASDP
jgi:peroxiredoxin